MKLEGGRTERGLDLQSVQREIKMDGRMKDCGDGSSTVNIPTDTGTTRQRDRAAPAAMIGKMKFLECLMHSSPRPDLALLSGCSPRPVSPLVAHVGVGAARHCLPQ
jgi:hypothetical protein